MNLSVGFDFGTHQTKICIENSENRALPTYEFFEFTLPDGQKTVLFPSIVQINEDGTLRYGSFDIKTCRKELDYEIPSEPIFDGGPEPKLFLPKIVKFSMPKLPPPPQRKKKQTEVHWQKEFEMYKDTCAMIKRNYKNDLDAYIKLQEASIERLKQEFELQHSEWQQRKTEYLAKHKEWELLSRHEPYLVFRYFKQAAVNGNVKWNHPNQNPNDICVLYLAYIMLLLKDRFQEQFPLQVGMPTDGTNYDDAIKNKICSLYVAAIDLSRQYDSSKEYLLETYENLIKKVRIRKHISLDALNNDYWLMPLPEAYAGLRAVTSQKRLERGFHLLVDIGGGTTDIAVFSTINGEPHIHKLKSFPRGLNYVLESSSKTSHKSMEELQGLFRKSPDSHIFQVATKSFAQDLLKNGGLLVMDIVHSFMDADTGFHISKLKDALTGRSVIYCGGGSLYENLHTGIAYFTDIRSMDKSFMNIGHIVNHNIPDEIYAILSISYGLSIPQFEDLQFEPISNVFKHIHAEEAKLKSNTYEHGLTDV